MARLRRRSDCYRLERPLIGTIIPKHVLFERDQRQWEEGRYRGIEHTRLESASIVAAVRGSDGVRGNPNWPSLSLRGAPWPVKSGVPPRPTAHRKPLDSRYIPGGSRLFVSFPVGRSPRLPPRQSKCQKLVRCEVFDRPHFAATTRWTSSVAKATFPPCRIAVLAILRIPPTIRLSFS
jgi:hypothetical protein